MWEGYQNSENQHSYNVSSVSEVQPLAWFWAKVQSTDARYTLLSAVWQIIFFSIGT